MLKNQGLTPSLFSAATGNGSGPTFRPLYPIQYLDIRGASIMDYTYDSDGDEGDMRVYLDREGLTGVEMVDHDSAVPGYDAQQVLDALPAGLADLSGLPDCLVVIHAGGNDVSRNGPWPNFRDELYDTVRQICQMIVDAGHRVCLLPLSARRLADGETRGTSPYNRYIYWPLIKEFCPEFWDNEQQRPVFDFFSWNYPRLDQIEADNVHPNDGLRAFLRAKFANVLANRYFNRVPSWKRAELFEGKRLVLSYGFTTQRQDFDGINAVLRGNETAAVTSTDAGYCLFQLRNTAGEVLDNSYAWAHNISGGGSAGNQIGTDDPVSLYTNNTALQGYAHIGNTQTATFELYGLPEGLSGTLLVAGPRSNAQERSTRLWLEEEPFKDQTIINTLETLVTEQQLIDQGAADTSRYSVAEFRFETRGEFFRMFAERVAGDYGYVSVQQFDFDDNTLANWSPTRLLGDDAGFYTSFDTAEGLYQDVDYTTPVAAAGDPVGSAIINGYRFTAYDPAAPLPTWTGRGIDFSSQTNMLVYRTADNSDTSLGEAAGRYPFTMVMKARAGDVYFGAVASQVTFWGIQHRDGADERQFTRNQSFVAGALAGAAGSNVLVGSFESPTARLFVDNAGPATHTIEPEYGQAVPDVALGGLSDETPGFSSGIMEAAFFVGRVLTDDERRKITNYMTEYA